MASPREIDATHGFLWGATVIRPGEDRVGELYSEGNDPSSAVNLFFFFSSFLLFFPMASLDEVDGVSWVSLGGTTVIRPGGDGVGELCAEGRDPSSAVFFFFFFFFFFFSSCFPDGETGRG